MPSCAYIRTCEAKKRAKLLHFFELAKYFLKKKQKKCIFLQNVRFR